MRLQQSIKQLNKVKRKAQGIALHKLLIVPFVLQIFTTVGLVGYFSLQYGQQAVNDLANQLMNRVNDLVAQHLDSYLATPHQINQLNVDAIEVGLLDLRNLEQAGHYFWKQMQVFDVSYISYALPTGEYAAAGRFLEGQGVTIDELSPRTQGKTLTYATDRNGNRTRVLAVYDYKPLVEAAYIEPVRAGKQLWTAVYNWEEAPEYISIGLNYPIYNIQRQLIGVIGVDLLLSKISKFLRKLKLSPSARIFIVESSGLLIASSSAEQPFTVVNGKAQRLNVSQSSDRLIQATAQYLQRKFRSFQVIQTRQQLNFQLDNERHYVQITPWYDSLGLNWFVIVVVPESDFMAQINVNTRITIVLCLLALIFATMLGTITSRWITQPIRRLSAASKAIANGKLDQTVEVKGVSELEVLSQSFNRMALQIKESFEQLETRVEQRTAELREAKVAAEAASRAKTEFLANMSHELRTPLNAILGLTKLMERDASLSTEQQENLGVVSRSGEHLLSLINDVLDMSKIEAGRSVVNKNNFDLYLLLHTIEEMFRLKATSKNLQLRIEQTLNVPQYISTDESKLRQILINLLGNAIKFTSKGNVTLRVSALDQATSQSSHAPLSLLSFKVEDTGPGIAPEELEQLFQPFVQTEAGRKSEQGTGLGLSISRKFVQLMGGKIAVSTQVGEGSIFQFEIPVELAQLIAVPQHQPPQRVVGLEPGQPTYRVLIADDHWANRRLLNQMLSQIGFEVCEADNGQNAIALWQSWEPHLIWMDMQMPVVNGYEATKQIKSHLKGQATTIIAITASTFEKEHAIVLSAGCDDFVCKPFRQDTIWKKMAQHLGVRYTYEHNQTPTSQQLEPQPHDSLTAEKLNVMPSAWISQLHHAATKLDAEALLNLIAQIPEAHALLAQALQQKVNNFDFDQIMHLAQPIHHYE